MSLSSDTSPARPRPRFSISTRVTGILALLLATMTFVGGVQVLLLRDLQREVQRLAGKDVQTMQVTARIDRETTLLIGQIANLALATSRPDHRTSRLLLQDYIRLFDEAAAQLPLSEVDAHLLEQLEVARKTFASTAHRLGELVGRRLELRKEVEKAFRGLVRYPMNTTAGRLWKSDVLTSVALALRHMSPFALRSATAKVHAQLEDIPEELAGETQVDAFARSCEALLVLQRRVLDNETAIAGAMKQGENEASVLRSLTANLAHRQSKRVAATADRSLRDLRHALYGIYLAGTVMLAVTAWVGLYITLAVSRRLNRMAGQLRGSEASGEILEGKELHLPEEPRDELGALASALNSYNLALRKSEEKFRHLVESSSDWIWETDTQGRFTYASPQVKSLLGYAPEEILGKTPFDLMPPPERRRLADIFKHVQAKKAPLVSVEQVCLHKDGHLVSLETNGVPMLDYTGLLLGYRGMDKDVSARKRAEQALRESEARYRSLFEDNSVVMLLIDPQSGAIIDANKAASAFYGWDQQTLRSMRITDINMLSPQAIRKEMQAAWKEGKGFFDFRHRLANGRIRDVEVYSGPISVYGQDLLHSSIVDVTERKQAEHELRKFRLLVENSPLSIVITDTNGAIEYVNPAFAAITGYTSEEVVGQNPRILKSGVHDTAFYQHMWQTIIDGRIWKNEICNRKKNGDIFWEQSTIAPVKNETGAVANYAAIKEDISHRKELERLKEDVDRIMRHDLKTPLTAILNLPRLLEMEGNLTREQQEIIRVMEDAAENMRRLIDLSLDMFKMETGTYRYTPQQVDVMAVLGKLVEENRTTVDSCNLQIRILLNEQLPAAESGFLVWSEERLLYTLLSNLFTNAIEASPEGAEVLFSVKDLKPEPFVEISICNTGAVPQPVREHFFKKYQTHGKSSGTGLGTYSAKLMADVMHYDMRMETSDATDSTCVSITIPKGLPAEPPDTLSGSPLQSVKTIFGG